MPRDLANDPQTMQKLEATNVHNSQPSENHYYVKSKLEIVRKSETF